MRANARMRHDFNKADKTMTKIIDIRPAGPNDNEALANAFYKMWIDNGRTDADFIENWPSETIAFMTDSERESSGRAFVADYDGQVLGAAQCLISRKLYPQALKPDVRMDGYIWGVYVERSRRRNGLATRLTEHCIAYLKEIGCTRIILHASPGGQPVYAKLGFNPTNEMRLDVT